MKYLNHIGIILCLIGGLPFHSCSKYENDTYGRGNSSDGSSFIELGTITAIGGNREITVEGDTYGTSHIANSRMLIQQKIDSIGQRVLYLYRIDAAGKHHNGKYIHIYEIQKVLTKQFLVTAESGHLGNDPIGIVNAYVSANHLNINYSIYTGFMGGKAVAHDIHAAVRPDAVLTPEGYLPIELFHHVNGDESGKESQRWASFALSSARPLYGSKTKGFLLTYPTSSGKAVRKIDIKPHTSPTP